MLSAGSAKITLCVCWCVAKASYINASNAENMKNVWHVIKHTAQRRMKDACRARNKMKRAKEKEEKEKLHKHSQCTEQIMKEHYQMACVIIENKYRTAARMQQNIDELCQLIDDQSELE